MDVFPEHPRSKLLEIDLYFFPVLLGVGCRPHLEAPAAQADETTRRHQRRRVAHQIASVVQGLRLGLTRRWNDAIADQAEDHVANGYVSLLCAAASV